MEFANVKVAHIAKNLNKINRDIIQTAQACKRDPTEIQLIAVSKRQAIEKIQAAIDAGQKDFAENQIQEALPKIQSLSSVTTLIWHYIGSVQSNKTRAIAENFDWLHSLASLKHAQRLNEQRQNPTPLNVCIQINIDQEDSKSGIATADAIDFASRISNLHNLSLRGLMCIPQRHNSEDAFYRMQSLFLKFKQDGFNIDTLSMGMSADFHQAIKYGSTMLRVGTALFGERDQVE